MAIRQQGGVFGRNPRFADVSASKLNVDNVQVDGNTISTTDTNGNLLLAPNGSGLVRTSSIISLLAGRDFRLSSDGSGFLLRDASAGRDLLRGTLAGDISLPYGNLVVTNGKGIDFSATPGTGTSELFDDYEEGTWTPALTFLFGSAGISYTNRYGFYTKVGNKVYVTATFTLSSKGTGNGNAYVNGLPFVSGNFSGNSHAFSLTDISNLTYTGQVSGLVYANAGFMYFEQTTEAGVNSRLNETNFANNTTVVLSGSYFV